jgi:hypothetical protein
VPHAPDILYPEQRRINAYVNRGRKRSNEFRPFPFSRVVESARLFTSVRCGRRKVAICRNPKCDRSYQRHDGIVLVDLVRILRAIHTANRVADPIIIQRLTELAQQIYQSGAHCAGCNQPMVTLPGPGQAQEVNDLLQNTEVLQIYGVPT